MDNSDYMRNGDFAPSRMDAQLDAVNLLAGVKTQSNPENTVGVLTMAGKGVEVRVSMTSDVGKVLAQSHGAQMSGEINLSAGLQVAGLALKHRQNKNQRQRVIVFVGSPIAEEESVLVKLGKKLKKNSCATCPWPATKRGTCVAYLLPPCARLPSTRSRPSRHAALPWQTHCGVMGHCAA
jgi:26S proteasome regulatory subunit N10